MKAIIFLIFNVIFCKDFNPDQQDPLPDFRRRMEEIIDDTIPPVENTEDPSHSIVSFLIQNVKEIFKDSYDSNDDDEEPTEETQTDSVNVIRRKQIENAFMEDAVLDKVKMIADVTDTERPTYYRAYHKINNPDIPPHIFKQDFNIKLIDEQNNERDLELNQVKQHIKKTYEQDLQQSTILFRPVYEFETRFTRDTVTEIYYENRPTTLLNPKSEFENSVSVLTNNENLSISDVLTNNEELSTQPYIISKSFYKSNPLPFLVSKKFQAVTEDEPNTAKGLIFLSGHGTETPMARTTILERNITRSHKVEDFTTETDTATKKPVHVLTNFDVVRKEPKRSCIQCNNAVINWCSAPKNKLIPSTICTHYDDLCYSMHTPFGIVERGCFSINHNMSTYVCGSNLCNYIAFADLPVIFASKQKWIEDIYDLTHLKSLRKSTMKNLSCLKCEVNTARITDSSIADDHAIYNINCMEGKPGIVQRIKCKEDEICAIKTIKHEGYIWRGCVSAPLYNYYIKLCDSDLCNYDPIASVYDFND